MITVAFRFGIKAARQEKLSAHCNVIQTNVKFRRKSSLPTTRSTHEIKVYDD